MALLAKLRKSADELFLEVASSNALCGPYKFPSEPTLESVTKTLYQAIDWHVQCQERCAYGTYPMIVDTCIWISMAKLTTSQIHGLCVLLNRLYHEALGKWG